MRILRLGLSALLLGDLLAVVLLTAADPALLSYPGGRGFALRVVGGLLAYAVVVFWATGVRRRSRAMAVSTGATLGLAGGALDVALQLQQRFVPIGSPVGDVVSVAVTIVVFGLWSVAGYRAIRLAGRRLSAAIAGPWSGCVTMTLAVTCKLVLALVAAPASAQVARWAAFRDSTWTDMGAFATANSLDDAFTRLCAGPLIGLIVGTAGGALGRSGQRRQAKQDAAGG